MTSELLNLENMKICVGSRLRDLLSTENILELRKTKEAYQLLDAKIKLIKKELGISRDSTDKSSDGLDTQVPKQLIDCAAFKELDLSQLLLRNSSKPNYTYTIIPDTQQVNENYFKKIDFEDDTPRGIDLPEKEPFNPLKCVSSVSLPPEVNVIPEISSKVFNQETVKKIRQTFKVAPQQPSQELLVPAPDHEYEI
jgi:hypothetical protein